MICKSRFVTVRSSVGLLLACALLSGCTTFCELFNSCPVVNAGCPALKTYSKDTQTRAADELAKLPAGSAVGGLLRDYKSLRDACRTI